MAVFVKVAERGSFAGAADVLGLSAQMVGRHVQSLEERLGVRLINRSTRRQSLTDEGSVFLERCRLIVSEVEAAEADASESRAKPTGRLRVDAPVTFGTHCLVPALPIFLRANPAISVELTLNNRNVDVVEEGYDVVVRVGALSDTGLAARSLAPYRFVACASPRYLEERGAPDCPEALDRHQCLGFAGTERASWTFQAPDGRTLTRSVDGWFRANNGEALRAAALAGLGIIVQPEALLAADVENGKLVPVLAKFPPRSLPLNLLFAASRRPTPKLRSFIDFMVARFGHNRSSES